MLKMFHVNSLVARKSRTSEPTVEVVLPEPESNPIPNVPSVPKQPVAKPKTTRKRKKQANSQTDAATEPLRCPTCEIGIQTEDDIEWYTGRGYEIEMLRQKLCDDEIRAEQFESDYEV